MNAVERLRDLSGSDRRAARQLQLIAAMKIDERGYPLAEPQRETLSQRPAVWRFPNFASPDECRYLVEEADTRLQPAVIVDPSSGQLRPDPVRTSESAAFPWAAEDLVISAINRRMAAASGTDLACGEPLQVLRYVGGQEYRPHMDALPMGGNQRVLTMLTYLNDGYRGGETAFVDSGLTFAGRTGDALLFRNADAAGRADPASRHAGLPVTDGTKYLASRWIREHPISVS